MKSVLPLESSDMTKVDKLSSYRWFILFLAVATYLMGFLSRFAWPPLVPVAVPALGFSMTEAGMYMTAFYLGYISTQIPGGMLGDRFGVRPVMVAALLIQATASGGLGFIHDFHPGFLLRVLSGLSAGAVYAVCFKVMVRWFSVAQRGLAFGFLMATPSLGITLSNSLAPLLEGLFDWRMVFKLVGAASLLVSVLVFLFMREGPAARSDAPGSTAVEDVPGFVSGLKYVLGNRNIMLLTLGGFANIWAQVGFSSWGNLYLKQELGLSLQAAGSIMTAFGLIGLVAAPLGGLLAGRSGKGRLILAIANVATLIGILCFGYGTSGSMLLLLTLLAGLGVGCQNALYGFVTSTYAQPKWAGITGGVTGFVYQLAGALVPLATGLAIDFGSFAAVWWILAAGPCVGLICVLLTRPASP